MLGQVVHGFAGGTAGRRCHHLPVAFGKTATRRVSTRSALEESPFRFPLPLRYSRPGPARKSLSKPCSFAPPMIRTAIGMRGRDRRWLLARLRCGETSRPQPASSVQQKWRLSSYAAIPTRGSRAEFRTEATEKLETSSDVGRSARKRVRQDLELEPGREGSMRDETEPTIAFSFGNRFPNIRVIASWRQTGFGRSRQGDKFVTLNAMLV